MSRTRWRLCGRCRTLYRVLFDATATITCDDLHYNIHNIVFSDRSISLLNNLLLSPSPSPRCRIPSRASWRNGRERRKRAADKSWSPISTATVHGQRISIIIILSGIERVYGGRCTTTAFRKYSRRKSSLKNNLFLNSKNSFKYFDFKIRIYTNTW